MKFDSFYINCDLISEERREERVFSKKLSKIIISGGKKIFSPGNVLVSNLAKEKIYN